MNKAAFLKRSLLSLVTSCFLLVTFFSGCGYTTRSLVSTKFRTIYIKPFVNKIDITQEIDTGNKYKIYRPALETEITRGTINKFLFDGNLKPVNSESSDVVLSGELVDFRREPVRWTSDNNEVEEYRVLVAVNLELWDNREKKVVWQENSFTGDSTYYTSFAPGNVVRKSENTAVTDAVTDLARRIVERTVEEW
ncbi:MAG: LPS assembly lipoprotein LptE [Candidatus Omnitrophota bacterium]|nr:hypothetical protein [Candidatus Omnitrophota bacterium]